MQVDRFSALRAAFLVPILLVISQPVRLRGAGRTVHVECEGAQNELWCLSLPIPKVPPVPFGESLAHETLG